MHLERLGDFAEEEIKQINGVLKFYPKKATTNLIGLKFASTGDKYPLKKAEFAKISLKITKNKGGTVKVRNLEVLDDGKYAILTFGGELKDKKITSNDEVTLSFVTHSHPLDVYVIAGENINDYSLPFIADSAKKMLQSEAEEHCQEQYGTSLLSVHSEEEMKLIQVILDGMASEDHFYIGLNDRGKKEGNWKWTDMSDVEYTNWAAGEPNSLGDNEDCVEMYETGWWNDIPCNFRFRPLCNNPTWSRDITRTFQINSDVKIDEVVSVAIGNNNEDDICVDAVSVDGEHSTYITSNWVSSESTDIMMAILEFPVCDSKVMSVTLEMESAKIDISEASTIGINCENFIPGQTQECGAGQTVELSKSQTFSYERSEGDTWGSSSSMTYGTSSTQSTSTTDEFSWGMGQSLTVGAETEVGIFGQKVKFSAEIGFSSNQQWTTTQERSTEFESSREVGKEKSRGRESWTTNQDETGEVATYATECSGTVTVPPEHSIQTMLKMTTVNTTVNTKTTIRLTRCSAFLNPEAPTTPADYIELNNIPGTIGQVEMTQCEVSFQPPQYLGPQLTCFAYQQYVISNDVGYTPDCQDENPDLYEPCQCDDADSRTLARCWCVNEVGRKIGDLISGEDSAKICQKLNCQPTPAEPEEERRRLVVTEKEETGLNNLRIVVIGSLMAVVLCVMVILYYPRVAKAEKKIQLLDEDNSVQV